MITKIKNIKISIIITILFLIIITIITAKIVSSQELVMDKIAYNILVEHLRTPTLTTFMKLVTKLSNTSFIVSLAVLLTILFYYTWKNKKLSLLIPLNLTVIVGINQLLKFIIQRKRPIGYRLIEMSGYSFPSGHAMVSMAFYGLLIYLTYHMMKKKFLKITLIILNILIILLIGISRVYLGVHYLSDVITGYLISIIYLLLLSKILKKHSFFP